MKTPPAITWTLSAAAREFGVDRETLRRQLVEIQQSPDKAGKFTSFQICRAVFGDTHRERFRKVRAERRLAEAAAAQRERELLPAKDVERAWSFMLQQARARWLQLPAKAALAFPTWPDAKACEAWFDALVRDLLTEFAVSLDYNAPPAADEGEELQAGAAMPISQP